MIIAAISKYQKFALYGAQVVAYGAYVAIKRLYKRIPECFVVSNLDGNPNAIDGIPVRMLDTLPTDTLIIIAVTELLQDEIAATLQAKDYRHSFKLTAHEEHLLMAKYYESIGEFPLIETVSSNNKTDFSLFEVRHHLDKPLQNAPKLNSWEIPIQAGAALIGKRICEQLDNIGDNISHKNKQYCEASVFYWVWKNASSGWVGIEHYRRHLLVCPETLNDAVDVILPLPYICYPSVRVQFQRFVCADTVVALLVALKTLYPNEYDLYVRCLNGKYHYAYNLIVAKKEVFSKYCEWMFSITDYIETLGIQDIEKTRALAYTVEMLTSIYFIANQNKLKIKHAEKVIYT